MSGVGGGDNNYDANVASSTFAGIRETATYWLADHPSIVNFRWSDGESWGSTWSFLLASLFLYLTSSIILHLVLLVLLPTSLRRRPVPLGPIPALHSLSMAVVSFTIFSGILLSAAAEIRETRWLWRRSKTATTFHWLLCFPLGTRPSGRVFFWSYAFYLSRFLRLIRTHLAVLRRRRLCLYQVFNHSILILMSFLWLEFSQSFQVLGIVFTTLVSTAVYGYRFWTSAVGLPMRACFPFVVNCQLVLLGCNVACHVGVLVLHLGKGGGGCNGIGAWGLNTVLNGAILLLFLDFYVKSRLEEKRRKKEKMMVKENEEKEMEMKKGEDHHHRLSSKS